MRAMLALMLLTGPLTMAQVTSSDNLGCTVACTPRYVLQWYRRS